MDIRSFIVHTLGQDSNDIDKVVPFFELQAERKGNYLLDSGDTCDYIYFLLEGCVIHRVDNGTEHPLIREIITPDMWFSDLKSFQQQTASNQCLECLSDVQYYQLHRNAFMSLELNFPNFNKVSRLVVTKVNEELEARVIRLKQLSAVQRWQWFQSQQRFQGLDIPKKIISEFLDMRPETLSRLMDS